MQILRNWSISRPRHKERDLSANFDNWCPILWMGVQFYMYYIKSLEKITPRATTIQVQGERSP